MSIEAPALTVKEVSSFRDPSGFVFYKDDLVFRSISPEYSVHYQHLMQSGLYEKLIQQKLLIEHKEVGLSPLTIQPKKIPFISYPHEWSFSQLKSAALTTLRIQQIAAEYGMQLKDASAYNIQFLQGKPVLIDTLSFELKTDSLPWKAYKQFCQHFLAPLALHAYVDWRLKDLYLAHIDGIPLDLAVKLLPKRYFLKFNLFLHLYLHAKFQSAAAPVSKSSSSSAKNLKQATAGLIQSLESAVKSIQWKAPKTTWQNYYQDDSYTTTAFADKQKTIETFLSILNPPVIWDMGCNDGYFSIVASRFAQQVVSFDADPVCIERLFHKKTNILPLMMNLSNPTPAFGWGEEERKSLASRGPASLVLALALIHHLMITAGISLDKIAEYFHKIGRHAVVEFIPKEDQKFKKMVQSNPNKFEDFNEESFLKAFSAYFEVLERKEVADSKRVLYLLQSKRVFTC